MKSLGNKDDVTQNDRSSLSASKKEDQVNEGSAATHTPGGASLSSSTAPSETVSRPSAATGKAQPGISVIHRLRARKFARYSLVLLVIGVGLVFFHMTRMFLVPVTLAAVFVSLFYPLYERCLKLTHDRRGLSAVICCLALSLGGLLPAYGVAHLVAKEAIRLYQSGGERTTLAPPANLKRQLLSNPMVKRLHLDELQLQASFEQLARQAAQLLGTVINKASRETFDLISNIFLTFFTMFYFFRDGPMLLARLRYFSPLSDEYEDQIIKGFLSASRATVNGTLLIGLIKGLLGGLTFWAFGIEAPVLWGTVMVFLSVLPVVGAWLVMYPAALFLLLDGHVWQGVTLFLIALLVIGSVDNLLEPFLVGRGAGMHDLIVFFSMLGGISLFGVMGFLVGPILAALFLTLLRIYGFEFRKQLRLVHSPPAPNDADPDSP